MRSILSISATLILLFSCLSISCSSIYLALEPVEEFDLERYMGKWYELYRLPNSFEEGLEEITAHYQLDEEGKIVVTNEGRVTDDKSRIKQAKGRAWIPNPKEPSKWKISFYWPISRDFWVLRVDPDYSYALVGDPSGKYLWILSREPSLDPKILSDLKIYASSLGFAVENLIGGELY